MKNIQNPLSSTLPYVHTAQVGMPLSGDGGIFIMRTISEAFDRIENEIWKPVVGFEKLYLVSNVGRVMALKKTVSHPNSGVKTYPKKILCQCINKGGYYQLDLSNNCISKKNSVHKIVAMAFIGYVPQKGYVINHIDGNKLNNNVCNLEVVTHRYNNSFAIRKITKSSKYVGVNLSCKNNIKYYTSYISINNIRINLGRYKSEVIAGSMYKIAYDNIDKFNGDTTYFRNICKNIYDSMNC